MSDHVWEAHEIVGLTMACVVVICLIILIILIIYILRKRNTQVHVESKKSNSVRKTRFHGTILDVDEKKFINSWFLKYYNGTSHNPTNKEIMKSLIGLPGVNNVKHPILQLIQTEDSNHNVLKVYSSNESFGSTVFYDYINEQLRLDNKHTLNKLMPFIRRATCQINPNGPSNNLTVYRGMKLAKNDHAFFTSGKKFRFRGFTSTSSQKEIATGFENTLLEIQIDAKCQQVRNISDISDFPNEHEWLFSPYSRFQVEENNGDVIRLKAMNNFV